MKSYNKDVSDDNGNVVVVNREEEEKEGNVAQMIIFPPISPSGHCHMLSSPPPPPLPHLPRYRCRRCKLLPLIARRKTGYILRYNRPRQKYLGNKSAFVPLPILFEESTIDYDEQLKHLSTALIPFICEQMTNNNNNNNNGESSEGGGEGEGGSRKSRSVKLNGSADVGYEVYRDERLVDSPNFGFSIKSRLILTPEEIEEQVEAIIQKLREQIVDRRDRGSNFSFKQINSAMISLCSYVTLKGGGSGGGGDGNDNNIDPFTLPSQLQERRGLLNIQSRDNMFPRLYIRRLYPSEQQHKERPMLYRPFHHEIHRKGVRFPITRTGVDQIERQNETPFD